MHRVTYAAQSQTYAQFHVPGRGLPVQININQFIEQSLTTEQRLGAELIKSLGLDGYSMDGLSLLDIFGAPGNSAMTSSAGHDIEQIRGWNHTAILAKSLQFALGNVGVFCPLPTAEAISAHHGEEYSSASRFTGMEQYGVPENWVQSPRQHRIAKLLKKPNPWCDEAQMLFQMAQQVEVHGVCYFLILPNQAGLPSQMWIIPRANIYPLSPSMKFPEGSYRVGNLSRVSIGNTQERDPESHQEALARLSNKEYSARWVIPVGLPSIVYSDDFMNMSAAIADALDTDTQIHQSRRKTLSKQMTNGPRIEPLPGTDFQASERDKLLETFEAENQGPENQGRPWMTPKGVKVVNDAHSAREMEYTDSANQSRDHVMGQRLMPGKMLGLGEGGAYAEIIGVIKNNNRNVLQPLMRILSGQLTIGLQRYFDSPQDEFMVLLQAGAIDDPEQKMREWQLLITAKTITKGQILKAFNLPPFGDERDDEIAGADPAPAGGQEQPGGIAALLQGAGKVPEKGIKGGEIGPEKPGVGAAVPPEATETEKSAPNVFGGLTRQQFVRNRKAVMETLQQFENGTIRERTAIATLKTLGLSSEQAREFVDSVKEDESAALPKPAAEEQAPMPPVAEAMFSRMLAPTSIDLAASTAQTSGTGDLRLPRDEELKTGAYKKGRFRIAGLAIAIENPARSNRSGVDESGKPWSVELNSHYGYIMGSTGFDKDQVDVYFPEYTESTFDGMVYVINQANADGTFDEHKVVIGCNSKTAAKGEYLSNYQDGWKSRIMSIVPLTMEQFKRWLFDPVDGPVAGELMPAMALQYMSIGTEQPAMPVPLTTKSVSYDDRLKKMHERRGEDSHGIAKTDSARDEERANLIADILVGAFGDDAEQMLADGDDFGMLTKMFAKLWDETKYRRHPRGARFGGRFAPKNSSEAVTAAHGAIDEALRGARSEESASELVDLLSNLTLNELRAVKDKYQMSASGRTKKDLVAKIAARLDSGRRTPVEPTVATVPEKPVTEVVSEVPSRPPTYDEEQRLMSLRERLPSGMLIIKDDDGNEMLVQGSNQYPLPALIIDQLPALESKLRELGHDPDSILAGTIAARPAPEPERPRIMPQPTPAQIDAVRQVTDGNALIINEGDGAGTVVVDGGGEWIVINATGTASTATESLANRIAASIDAGKTTVINMTEHPPRSVPSPAPAPAEPAPQPTREQTSTLRNMQPDEAYMVTQAEGRGMVLARTGTDWSVIRQHGGQDNRGDRFSEQINNIINTGGATLISGSQGPAAAAPQSILTATADQVRALSAIRHDDAYLITQPESRGFLAARTPTGWITISESGSVGRNLMTSQRMQDILASNGAVSIESPEQVSSPAREANRPVFSDLVASEAHGRRLTLLRNAPPGMSLDSDSTLPQSRRLRAVETLLAEAGYHPEDIANGIRTQGAPISVPQQAGLRPPTTPAPVAPEPAPVGTRSAKAQLKEIGADFLDKIKPEADGNLIQPRVSKAKVKIEHLDSTPRTWDEVDLSHRSDIIELWRDEQKKALRTNQEVNARWKSDADREAQSVVDRIPVSKIAEEVHKRITQTPGFETASVSDVATMIETNEATASSLAGQYKSEVKAAEIDTRLDGRRSWLRTKMKNELASRESMMSLSDFHAYERDNGHLELYKNKKVANLLKDFGLEVKDITSMIGAPDNVEFTVSATYDNGINLYSYGKVRMNRTIHKDEDGRLVVHNNSFFLDDDMPKGTGLEILANAVAYSKKMGAHKFYTNPCRSEGYTRSDGSTASGMVGYAVWPQFGYDAAISEIGSSSVRQRLQAEFPNARTIRDVYDTPGGQAWWWKNGTSINNADFYLADGSRNLKAMQSYMASKKAARERVKAAAKAKRAARE
jgi:hypothetical protein